MAKYGIRVHNDSETMNVLLISEMCGRAAMLRQVMEANGLSGEIRRMRPSKNAVAYAMRSGPFADMQKPDFILLDFSAPDRGCQFIVNEVAFRSPRLSTPVILLTSQDSEHLLQTDSFNSGDSNMFAPTSLFCFVRKMKQHSRGRFLGALSVMSDLGPILVRLPLSFLRQADDQPALIA